MMNDATGHSNLEAETPVKRQAGRPKGSTVANGAKTPVQESRRKAPPKKKRTTTFAPHCPHCGGELRGYKKPPSRQKSSGPALRSSSKKAREAVAVDYFSISEACAILGVTWQTVRAWIKKGKLEAYQFGAQFRIPARALMPKAPQGGTP